MGNKYKYKGEIKMEKDCFIVFNGTIDFKAKDEKEARKKFWLWAKSIPEMDCGKDIYVIFYKKDGIIMEKG